MVPEVAGSSPVDHPAKTELLHNPLDFRQSILYITSVIKQEITRGNVRQASAEHNRTRKEK